MTAALAPELMWNLYAAMLRVRRVEEAIAARYAEQEMRCPVHFCLGQEAIAAGVSAHLTARDQVYSGHRSHGHYLAKGGDLRAMLAEIYLRDDGCARGRGGSQHLIDLKAGFIASAPILAGTIPIAVGAAMGLARQGSDQVVVVYFGDGAIEEGAAYESLNFAAIWHLPVIFVCENNRYSVHAPLSVRQPKDRGIEQIATAFRMPGVAGDGNDVAHVHKIAGEAINKARAGQGPSLLVFETDRWLEHCGPNTDYHLTYRSQAEIDRGYARDPIKIAHAALVAANALDDQKLSALEHDIQQEIDSAFAFAKSSPFPSPTSLHDFVFPKAAAE
jgi:pyruvate dehydrogenase E1 component alpha subunit